MTTSSTPRRFGLDNRGTKACESCGVLSWASRQNDTANQALCTACFDAAGWENSHQDGNHEPGSEPLCPICDPEREERRLAKAAARVASYTASAAIKSAKAAQKELSYPHCPHCGDRRPKTKTWERTGVASLCSSCKDLADWIVFYRDELHDADQVARYQAEWARREGKYVS
jgi:NAD-dependent SIR2 family protein deacetylase